MLKSLKISVICFSLQSLIHVDSDEHIYKFVLSKFGFGQYKYDKH